MKTFKVGDRVVVVKAYRFHDLVGAVRTVLRVRTYADGEARYEIDEPERNPRDAVLYPLVWAAAEQLELYRPDHAERGEWTAELRKLCGVKESENA